MRCSLIDWLRASTQPIAPFGSVLEVTPSQFPRRATANSSCGDPKAVRSPIVPTTAPPGAERRETPWPWRTVTIA